MAIQYLKKSPKTSSTDDTKTREIVENILKDIEQSKEEGCKEYSKKFDKYEGDVVVSKERIEEIKKDLDQKTKDDIQFSHERVRKFAEAQLKNYGQDFEVELSDGLFAGQKLIPVNTAGCYVPAGRYAHIASAVMSVTTAKVAGVKNIIVASSPKPGVGVHPSIVYTADLCGADSILNLGGVQGIAAMTNGLFGNAPADILVGPGNQFVAEAKRMLFGKVGIDLFAGPTEIAVIADDKADEELVAVDLVGPIVPSSEAGYRYILTVMDYATRYPEAEVLKKIDAVTVAEALIRIFCRIGFPHEMLTDRGTQFMSDILMEVNRLLSVKHLRTTAWHPMCNGLVERFNGTLKTILKRLCAECPKMWDRYLPAVLFAYRSSVQESSGFTPFELVFGRKVRGPMDILRAYWGKEDNDEEVKTVYKYVVDLKRRLQETCNIAQEELLKAQEMTI